MNKLLLQIKKLLENDSDVFLVGKTNTGKTYFARSVLLKFLKEKRVAYFSNCDKLTKRDNYDYFIIDEVEILFDKDFLENIHKEKPYCSSWYLKKVKKWHKKLSLLEKPAVYIVTRNTKREFEFLSSSLKTPEWNNRKAKVLCLDKNIKLKKIINDQLS